MYRKLLLFLVFLATIIFVMYVAISNYEKITSGASAQETTEVK